MAASNDRETPGPSSACVCASLRKTARAVSQLYDEYLRPSGLRVTQFGLLGVLARGRPMTVGELATAMVMDRTTLTRNLRLVEREGWIHTTAGKDRRQRLVEITAAGRKVWESAIPHWRAAQRHMLDGIGTTAWPRLRDDLAVATDAARRQVAI
jgi:DNA-binding MarR family transcriptional regulator